MAPAGISCVTRMSVQRLHALCSDAGAVVLFSVSLKTENLPLKQDVAHPELMRIIFVKYNVVQTVA